MYSNDLSKYQGHMLFSAEQELEKILNKVKARAVPLITLDELGRGRQLEYQIAKLKCGKEEPQ